MSRLLLALLLVGAGPCTPDPPPDRYLLTPFEQGFCAPSFTQPEWAEVASHAQGKGLCGNGDRIEWHTYNPVRVAGDLTFIYVEHPDGAASGIQIQRKNPPLYDGKTVVAGNVPEPWLLACSNGCKHPRGGVRSAYKCHCMCKDGYVVHKGFIYEMDGCV